MSHNRTFLIAMSVFASYVLAFELLSFTLPLLALDISGTGTGLALIKGAGFIPNIIFAIFIGVINDRLRKSFGFRLYTGLLAFCTALLWLGLMRDLVSIPALAVFMIVFNATGYALGNMQLTLIKLTVPQSQLGSATALSAGINSTINTIAPAIGGLALLWFGHTSLTGGITALLAALMPEGYRALGERATIIDVVGFDWNCPQHITPRFTEAEIADVIQPLAHQIAQLRAEADALRAQLDRKNTGE